MSASEITPAQALGIIADRIQKRKEILKRVSDTGYNEAISELDIVRSQILKAQADFIAKTDTTARPRK